MDELAMLREFRSVDAEPAAARERTRAALQAAVHRERRRRRRVVGGLALLGVAIAAGAAYGVVHELVIGAPAPQEVREQPARFGHAAELIPEPHPDDPRLEDARVAAVLDSSVGTIYLFSSSNADGLCASEWLEGDRGYQGQLQIGSVCGPSEQSFYSAGGREYGGQSLYLFYGRAGDGVSRIALRFGDETLDIPLSGRWFLAELPRQPDAFLSYDGEGRVLEQRAFVRPEDVPPPSEPPHQLGTAHEVARIETEDGEEIGLFVADASNGYCQYVRSNKRPANQACGIALPGSDEIGAGAMNFGGAPGGVLLIVGPVGSEIETLTLRFQDGRVVDVPLAEGWALLGVRRADYVEGRRPARLEGLDASGKEIATMLLPWGVPEG